MTMPSKVYPQARIDELSKILDITQEEVLEMLKDDERIDKGEKLFELDAELEKGAKKARQAPRSANSTPTKRERKADTDKGFLIGLIKDTLNECGEIANLTIVNQERELTFELNDRKFKIVLSAPRS
jgi:hypothetical protein